MKSGNSLTTTNVQLSNCEVTLRGLVMTDALQSKIEGKIIGVVSKLGENMVTSTHITMSIDPRSQSCDVRCNMKGGALVEAKEHAENMYASIDLVSKTLSNNLKKFREKTQDKKQDGGKLGGTATEDELDIINEV
jgi:putative sigma-54 modulation protein